MPDCSVPFQWLVKGGTLTVKGVTVSGGRLAGANGGGILVDEWSVLNPLRRLTSSGSHPSSRAVGKA